jgi:alpha-galactosidase
MVVRTEVRCAAIATLLAAGCGPGLSVRPVRPDATQPALAPVPPDLTGFWVIHVPTDDGNVHDLFFELRQAGETMTGRVLLGPHEVSVDDGTFVDGKVHFALTFQGQTTAFDGALKGGNLSLIRQFPGKPPAPRIAERTAREATLPPPRLPLPELHDVPDNGLARTPPMGWSSWNKLAEKVDDASVRAMADAMVATGMKDAGYTYVNIDDAWEGPRDAQGNITSNRKFPDMKALADYVHSKGLKIGIYSSPGPKTCADYPGSYGHEEQDAGTFAAWGFDYLKYDWCSAASIYKNEEMQAVYQKMGDALSRTGRPIVFSLCQYGLNDVWTWGTKVGGNLWRTTGDIADGWQSMTGIGFSQLDATEHARLGHWNDPDMLEIGNGGMSADEYRTHMSLWALLGAPLLAGNDLRAMSDETRSILTNAEVIAIDQDPLGRPARKISEQVETSTLVVAMDHGPPGSLAPKISKQGSTVVVARPLDGGALAVGLFNRSEAAAKMAVSWEELGLHGRRKVRDLWAHRDQGAHADRFSATVPAHGVVLLAIKP